MHRPTDDMHPDSAPEETRSCRQWLVRPSYCLNTQAYWSPSHCFVPPLQLFYFESLLSCWKLLSPGQRTGIWRLSAQEHLQSVLFTSAQQQWLNCWHCCTASVAIARGQLSALQVQLEISGSGLLEGFKIRTSKQPLTKSTQLPPIWQNTTI